MDHITLPRYLVQNQQIHHDATGDFTILIQSIQTCCKYINSKVRKSSIATISGLSGQSQSASNNITINQIANEIFIQLLGQSQKVCLIATYLNQNYIEVESKIAGKYVLVLDALDGECNLDAAIVSGSSFAIYKRKSYDEQKVTSSDVLRAGKEVCAAGYCLYGQSTQMVFCSGNSVDCFTLDQQLGEFILTKKDIQIPESGKIYSMNEGYIKEMDKEIRNYVDDLKKNKYSLRYSGSLSGDIHRILFNGGIYMYPSNKNKPQGKLQTLFEIIPMSFIIEKAGGKSLVTDNEQVIDALEMVPQWLHESAGFFCGSKQEIMQLNKKLNCV